MPNLIAAIKDAPFDFQSRLVLADHLIAQGDERGELIVLDCLELTAGLTDPEALERLLLLAAEYTFPQPRDLPEEPLVFRGTTDPVELVATRGTTHYRVRFRRGRLRVGVQHGVSVLVEHRIPATHGVKARNRWTTQEAEQILGVLSDAVVHGAPLGELQTPLAHDPLPVYPAGAVRCYRLPLAFTGPRRISPTRYGLAARDHQRWHALWDRLRAIAPRAA